MWTDKARREAVALAVVLTTTFGGWQAQHAQASERVAVKKAADPIAKVAKVDPVEAMFSYGDLLEPVQYQASFEPDARDGAALASACAALLEAQAPKDELRAAAAPIVAFCHGDQSTANHVAEAFVAYREKAFELAS